MDAASFNHGYVGLHCTTQTLPVWSEEEETNGHSLGLEVFPFLVTEPDANRAQPLFLTSRPLILPSLLLCRPVMDLLWVLSVSMLTACVAIPMDAAAGSHSLFTCEPITLRMCQGLPYNSTFMPNILNHYDQQTAALAMEVQYNADVKDVKCFVPAPVIRLWGLIQIIPNR